MARAWRPGALAAALAGLARACGSAVATTTIPDSGGEYHLLGDPGPQKRVKTSSSFLSAGPRRTCTHLTGEHAKRVLVTTDSIHCSALSGNSLFVIKHLQVRRYKLSNLSEAPDHWQLPGHRDNAQVLYVDTQNALIWERELSGRIRWLSTATNLVIAEQLGFTWVVWEYSCVLMSADGSHALLGTRSFGNIDEHWLLVVDVKLGTLVTRKRRPEQFGWARALSHDGSRILAVQEETSRTVSQLQFWCAKKMILTWAEPLHGARVQAAAYSPNGKLLWVAFASGVLRSYNLKRHIWLKQFSPKAKSGDITISSRSRFTISGDGQFAVLSKDKPQPVIQVLELNVLRVVDEIELPPGSYATRIDITGDGNFVLAKMHERGLYVWDRRQA